MENVWAMISKSQLISRINNAVDIINETKVDELKKLFQSMPRRILSVIKKNGGKINY